MNRYLKIKFLNIGLIIFILYLNLASQVSVTIVYSVESEGTIVFTGIYELPGTPEPAPEVEVKPNFPKEIVQPPSEVRKSEHKRLPQTNESQMSTWTIWGILIIVVTLGFWFWKHKKKKQ